MLTFKLHYWPILSTVWLILTYFSSYFIAIGRGDVYPLFPYISDTGALPVESCVFGQMLNLGAVFMFIPMFIRHKMVQLYMERKMIPQMRKFNNFTFALGSLGCLGISFVANFQEFNNIEMHFLGAFNAFLLGSAYFCCQTYISWKTNVSRLTKITRLMLSLTFFPLYVLTTVASSMASNDFKGDTNAQLHWNPDDEGYAWHLVSTFSEWIMAILINLYMITFTSEFKQMHYSGIILILKP